jgi:NDP-sugar pyrophosphorylase family protein
MDAVVLCGGKGTRLASVVTDVPKPLAAVGGGVFMDHLL